MKHVCIGLAFLLASSGADAAIINWTADLAPESEVPPVTTSDASGSATGSVNTLNGLLSWNIDWTGLTGPAVAAHFHAPATPQENAGIVVNIGAISGLIPPTMGSTTISPPQVQGLLAGLWYINVHTEANPSGEIRGQVALVPLPATLPLLLAAAGTLGLARRRTRKPSQERVAS